MHNGQNKDDTMRHHHAWASDLVNRNFCAFHAEGESFTRAFGKQDRDTERLTNPESHSRFLWPVALQSTLEVTCACEIIYLSSCMQPEWIMATT